MTATDQNAPGERKGPRPLMMHLAMMTGAWTASSAALPFLKSDSPPWKGRAEKGKADLAKKLKDLQTPAFAAALNKEAAQRLRLFHEGVAAYHAHPYHRDLPEPPACWQEGSTRLLDFGGSGKPLLLVPSLINKAYIFDLAEKRSFARYLRRKGFRPLLVDWGAPGEMERRFTLTDYVVGRLERVLDDALAKAGVKSLGVIGYCMGGLLALALAQRRLEAVERLALLATPWDFHADAPEWREQMASFVSQLAPVIEAEGVLSIDLIQMLFAALDPFKVPEKFQKFSGLDPASAKVRDFVAVEDWVNDGVPLAGPVARETLEGWYGENQPAQGRWFVGGRAVLPEEVKKPTLVVVPSNDRIVPPQSALALYHALPNASKRVLSQGHISMVTGPQASRSLYGPTVRWFGGER